MLVSANPKAPRVSILFKAFMFRCLLSCRASPRQPQCKECTKRDLALVVGRKPLRFRILGATALGNDPEWVNTTKVHPRRLRCHADAVVRRSLRCSAQHCLES